MNVAGEVCQDPEALGLLAEGELEVRVARENEELLYDCFVCAQVLVDLIILSSGCKHADASEDHQALLSTGGYLIDHVDVVIKHGDVLDLDYRKL